jgi:hypothetical protein
MVARRSDSKAVIARADKLTLQILAFVFDFCPFFVLGQGVLFFVDHGPIARFGDIGIDFFKFFLIGWQVNIGVNGVDWAFGHAHGAVDALHRINHQSVGAFQKAIDRTDINTVGVFAFDTGFGYYKSHGRVLEIKGRVAEPERVRT